VKSLADLRLDYRAAFLRHLGHPEESALHAGYELGRAALASGITLLELVRVHHDVLIGTLRDSPSDEVPDVAAAASDFLLEVLSSYDMSQPRRRTGPAGTAEPGVTGGT
jgi:hypothetical protein